MADPEHLKILRRGPDAWNEWRALNPGVEPDLTGVHLNAEFLVGINFSNAFLPEATIINSEAALANFTGAFLKEVNFNETNLEEASLRSAVLTWTIFSHAKLAEADFTGAHTGWTTFGNNDLSKVKGLGAVSHIGPSIVGVETIYRSNGNIPEEFLRGCGVPDELIIYARSLATAQRPIQFYSCFISYSSRDQEFADRLYGDLQDKGVRCWFAPEDLKIGDRFRDRIDESIRLHDKLLLILSGNSVSSPWVGDEVESAIERERREGRTVLFPIKIDEAVMESTQSWAAAVRRTRHIGDFTGWKDPDSYEKAFDRLLRDLKAEESSRPSYLTPDSLENRAVLSPRNTLTDAWDEVEDSIIQLAKREGLVKEGELVDCGQLVNQLHKAGKIADAVRERFFTMSKVHFSVAFNSSMPVEPGMAIDFVNRARELQKALAVDTPPLP